MFMRNLASSVSRRKPLSEAMGSEDSRKGLKRSLTAFDLILYGVGGSVGAGIYCLVGLGAELAGPGIAISFLTCGMACIFTSLAYAEFAARIPVTGSAYIYAYVSFGEFYGWIVGWFLTLGYGFTASVVARSWAEYLADFLRDVLAYMTDGKDFEFLEYLTRFPIPFVAEGYTCSPLSVVIIALCTYINVAGAKESSRFNNAMTVLNISVLAFVVFAGFGTHTVSSDNLEPFFPHGIAGVSQGAGLVFFAFIGFDMVACLSEEVINPEVNMPIGIVGSLLICTGIYVAISLVVVGMAPVELLGVDVPITNALFANACCTHSEQLQENASQQCLDSICSPVLHSVLLYGGRFVSFGAIFGLTSGTFTSLMGQPRIWYRMAQDGLFFQVFASLNEETQVPTAGMIVTGVGASFLACFVELSDLANLISLGTLMVFTFVDAGVIILRLCPFLDKRPQQNNNMSSSVTESDDEFQEFAVSQEASPKIHGPPPCQRRSYCPSKLIPSQLAHIFGQTAHSNGAKPIFFTLLFTISSIVGFCSIVNEWERSVPYFCFGTTAVSAFVLALLPTLPPPDTFGCPLVPIVPLIGILSNSYMMGSLPFSAWLFAFVWFSAGVGVYFAYGVWHSKLNDTSTTTNVGPSTEYTPLSPVDDQSDGYDSTMEISLHDVHNK